VVQLDLEHRKPFDGTRKQIADTDEIRIGDRSDDDAARDVALDRVSAAAQRLRAGDDLLGFGKQPPPGGRQLHAARDALE
jgi:hypothetical protein